MANSSVFNLDLNASSVLADLPFADSLFQGVEAVAEKEQDFEKGH